MATYEEIYGKRVEVFDSDPTLDSSYEGQVWYNSATGTLKSVVSFSAWSSQPNTINNLGGGGSMGFGTSSTSALYTGGGPVPSPTNGSQKTEEWNGVGFEAKADIPQTTNQMNDGNMGFGTTTSGLVSGSSPGSGVINNWSQDWNGTSWEATPTMPTTGRGTASGYGVLTAGLNIGGYGNPIPPGRLNRAEEYTGSAWTAGGTLSQARYNIGGGAGTQTSAAACGGQGPSDKESQTENYDGSSFTTGVSLPQKIRGGRTAGTSDSSYIFWGGSAPPGAVGETLEFDGTAFTDLGADMGTAGSSAVCAGTTTAAINIMSGPPPGQNKTQQFNKSISTITPGAWASGGSLNQGRYWLGSANQAPSSAALGFAGYLTPGNTMYALTEEYDGTSWTEKGDLNLARSGVAGAGTATAALCIGGYVNAVGTKGEVEEFNGSSWSEETNLGTARYGAGGAGTQTAAVCMSGYSYPPASYKSETEEYDGSSWSESGDVSTARNRVGGCGTQTAALICGGFSAPSGALTAVTEEYNGSSWTTGGAIITATSQLAAAGSQTSALAFGGYIPADTNVTLRYDGSAWSTQPNLGTARRALVGTGSTSAGLAFGGAVNLSTTEEFTGQTTAVTAKTLTTG